VILELESPGRPFVRCARALEQIVLRSAGRPN
jgi:hypothetical protein